MAAKNRKSRHPNRGPAAIDNLKDRAIKTIQRWRETYTVDEIAAVLGCSKGSVWRWDHALGFPFRKTAEDILNNKKVYTDRLKHNRGDA